MLIDNAGAVARRAYSMWAFYIIAMLEVLPEVLTALAPAYAIEEGWITTAQLAAVVAGILGRLLRQRSLSGGPGLSIGGFLYDEDGSVRGRTAVITATAAGLAATVAYIAPKEGLRLTPYRDVAGVLTVCYGETSGVERRTYSEAECQAMLEARVQGFERRLNACIDDPAAIPEATKIALISWAYNVGSGAACGSTLVRKINAGDLRGACEELPRWNRAGGQVVRGLVNRRADERRLCLSGLEAPGMPVPIPAPPVLEPIAGEGEVARWPWRDWLAGGAVVGAAVLALVVMRRRRA